MTRTPTPTFDVEHLVGGVGAGQDGQHEEGVGEAQDVAEGPGHARVLDAEGGRHAAARPDPIGQQAT